MLCWLCAVGLGWGEPLVEGAPVRGGLVVCVEPLAARAGAEAMRRGGNAVDAAVATALALAVTHPEAGNLGGGGFLLARLPDGRAFAVDFRETAPAASSPAMFLRPDGSVDPDKEKSGWLTVGVPGSPHGLWTAHRLGGRLPWRTLVQPAIELADKGFPLDKYLADGLARHAAGFRKHGHAAKVFLAADGTPLPVGHRLVQPDLARTLRLLADKGADGFYQGETAERLVAGVRAGGGILSMRDLADYRAAVREPLRGTYRGVELLTMPPPSSGGATLLLALNILEDHPAPRGAANDPAWLHAMAEALRRAFLDRARHLGDSDFVAVPLHRLLSKEYAAGLRRGIGQKASSSAALGADLLAAAPAGRAPEERDHTTHFSAVDPAGGMVACTTTLEDAYGSLCMAPGTGFLLNDEMHDFNVTPGRTTPDGRIGTPANLIAPGKRMLSSMCPVLAVKDGEPYLALGSPGGRTIISTVLRVFTNVADHRLGIQAAVDAPRLHHQWMPDALRLEGAMPEAAAAALRAMGHRVERPEVPGRGRQGDGHSILVDRKEGLKIPGIDRRLRGAAAGF